MMNAGGRHKTHAVARRLRLRGHLSGTAINPRPVTLLDRLPTGWRICTPWEYATAASPPPLYSRSLLLMYL